MVSELCAWSVPCFLGVHIHSRCGFRAFNPLTDLPLHANLRALLQVSCELGSFLQSKLGNRLVKK